MDHPVSDELFGRYHRDIHRYLSRMSGQSEVADDLSQEVFLRALHASGNGHGATGHERGWMFSIARSVLADYRRQAGRRVPGQFAGPGTIPRRRSAPGRRARAVARPAAGRGPRGVPAQGSRRIDLPGDRCRLRLHDRQRARAALSDARRAARNVDVMNTHTEELISAAMDGEPVDVAALRRALGDPTDARRSPRSFLAARLPRATRRERPGMTRKGASGDYTDYTERRHRSAAAPHARRRGLLRGPRVPAALAASLALVAAPRRSGSVRRSRLAGVFPPRRLVGRVAPRAPRAQRRPGRFPRRRRRAARPSPLLVRRPCTPELPKIAKVVGSCPEWIGNRDCSAVGRPFWARRSAGPSGPAARTWLPRG